MADMSKMIIMQTLADLALINDRAPCACTMVSAKDRDDNGASK